MFSYTVLLILLIISCNASGANRNGELTEVMEEVVDVSAMNETILVLTASGDVYGFGNNQYGQLGVGDTKEYTNTRRDLAEVTLTVLARICEILDCDFGDIMEYIPERRRRSYYEILLLVALLLE